MAAPAREPRPRPDPPVVVWARCFCRWHVRVREALPDWMPCWRCDGQVVEWTEELSSYVAAVFGDDPPVEPPPMPELPRWWADAYHGPAALVAPGHRPQRIAPPTDKEASLVLIDRARRALERGA